MITENHAAYTSRFFQALIKIYTPCNLPNLFSCQISSSGEPPLVVGLWPVSQNQLPSTFILPACAGMGLAQSRVVQTPDCLQPNVRRQATFLNRDTDSVVALTPNITLDNLLL